MCRLIDQWLIVCSDPSPPEPAGDLFRRPPHRQTVADQLPSRLRRAIRAAQSPSPGETLGRLGQGAAVGAPVASQLPIDRGPVPAEPLGNFADRRPGLRTRNSACCRRQRNSWLTEISARRATSDATTPAPATQRRSHPLIFASSVSGRPDST